MKVCKSCGLSLPRTDYYTKLSMADGLVSECKRCYGDRQRRQRPQAKPRFVRTPKPPKIADGVSPEMAEHIEMCRQIGVHRAMDVWPDRCQYHFGTNQPCLCVKAPSSHYCPHHRDIEAAR